MENHIRYSMIKADSHEWRRIIRDISYFIVTAGSDFRAYESLNRILEFKIKVKKFLIINFSERKSSVTKISEIQNYDKYKKILNNQKYEEISCSIKDPSSFIKTGLNKFNFGEEDAIAIDISCFTKPYYFMLLKYLKENIKLKKVYIFYTEPKHYIFLKGEYHSSYGPLTVKQIPGFTGQKELKRKKLLIILLGFDGELSHYVSEDVAPNKIILINGFPSYLQNFKDLSIINNEKVLNYSPSEEIDIRYVSASNPFETYNLLEKILSEETDYHHIISPLGTKPMALGACVFSIHHPEVKVVYPLPEKYADKTTDDCSISFLYEILLKYDG